jgi:hypothetical protein
LSFMAQDEFFVSDLWEKTRIGRRSKAYESNRY